MFLKKFVGIFLLLSSKASVISISQFYLICLFSLILFIFSFPNPYIKKKILFENKYTTWRINKVVQSEGRCAQLEKKCNELSVLLEQEKSFFASRRTVQELEIIASELRAEIARLEREVFVIYKL